MPLLMGELLASWRELVRRMVDLPPGDPRVGRYEDLERRMQETYQRLCHVYPRTLEDTDLIVALIAEAHGLEATAATDG